MQKKLYPFEDTGNTNGDRSNPFNTRGSWDVGIGFGYGDMISDCARLEFSRNFFLKFLLLEQNF